MSKENYYEVLGVAINAEQGEIRKAYYGLAKNFHPDHNQIGNPERYQLIKSAYETLMDGSKRSLYDREIGIARAFGNSSISEEFSSLPFGRGLGYRSKEPFFFRLIGSIKKLLAKRNPYSKQSETSVVQNTAVVSSLAEDSLASKVSLSVYSEESFPLDIGESLYLSAPEAGQSLDKCRDLIGESLLKYPVIDKAYLIQARVSSLPEDKVYLIFLEKKTSDLWGVDGLSSVEMKDLSEDFPPIIFCNSKSGPFAEVISQNGTLIYQAKPLQ